MPEKRKRGDISSREQSSSDTVKGTATRISAFAAAKLKSPVSGNIAITVEVPQIPLVNAGESDADRDDDDHTEQATIEAYHNLKLCNWRYKPENIIANLGDQITIILNRHATISLIGCYDLKILKGAININGANFSATSRETVTVSEPRVYVPSTHPIITIKGLDSRNEIRFSDCAKPTPFAIISPLFQNIWNAQASEGPHKSFDLLLESDADLLKRPINSDLAPEDWLRQIEQCASSLCITLISGPPLTGKSTFANRLVNRYLTGLGKNASAIPEVFYLDLDQTNPEFTPDGQISLVAVREVNLGPSFTHPSPIPCAFGTNELLRAHPLPVSGFHDYHKYFMACVEDLLHRFVALQQQARRSVPLIINTPGWIFSNDFETLLCVVSKVRPQRVVHVGNVEAIGDENAGKFEALKLSALKHGIVVDHISMIAKRNAPSRTAEELRSMHMLSYFHSTGLTDSGHAQRTYHSKPLSRVPPWEFCHETTNNSHQSFCGFLTLGEWVQPDDLVTAINGSIVHIVETEDESVHGLFGNLPRSNRFHIPFFEQGSRGLVEPLDPKTSRIVCTALLRGWDPKNRIVTLIVPKTHESLIHGLEPAKTVVVTGCSNRPEWVYTEDAYYDLHLAGESQGDVKMTHKDSFTCPWTVTAPIMEHMGYLCTARRVRKFQQ